ncbi:MAG: ABC transporter permease [Bacteroidales bacterium]|nr:ABC transporter permease [Bacteroidales bacterium]
MARKDKHSYLSTQNIFTSLCMFYERVFNKDTGNHNEFKRLFFEHEGSVLLDRKNRYKNFRVLLWILLITFLAIGFSGGSIMYLDKKMNDPFVNFSNIIVPYDLQDSANMIIEEIQPDSILKKQYNINNLTGFSVFPRYFVNKNDLPNPYRTDGRTIDLDNPILSTILSSDNLKSNKYSSFDDPSSCGIIVTENLLDQIGLNLDSRFVQIRLKTKNKRYADIPVPILAVVENLPNDSETSIDFLVTEYMFYNIYYGRGDGSPIPFDPIHTKDLIFHINTTDTIIADTIINRVKDIFSTSKEILRGYRTPFRLIKKDDYSDSPYGGFICNIRLTGKSPDFSDVEEIFHKLILHEDLKEFKDLLVQLYTPNLISPEQMTYLDFPLTRISVHFNDLSKIEDFSNYFKNKHSDFPRIDIAQVHAKKNFNYVIRLTIGISFILLIISIYSVTTFVTNIFKNHFDIIKMNIGTLMAFGTKGLKDIYKTLMMVYIIFPTLFALVIATLLGYSFVVYFFLKLFSWESLEFERYFNLYEWGYPLFLTLISIVAIIGISSFRFRKITNTLFSRTPGDLIFDRELVRPPRKWTIFRFHFKNNF